MQSVLLRPDDEECDSLIQSKESLKVNISTVHNVKSSWLGNENVKNIDIIVGQKRAELGIEPFSVSSADVDQY